MSLTTRVKISKTFGCETMNPFFRYPVKVRLGHGESFITSKGLGGYDCDLMASMRGIKGVKPDPKNMQILTQSLETLMPTIADYMNLSPEHVKFALMVIDKDTLDALRKETEMIEPAATYRMAEVNQGDPLYADLEKTLQGVKGRMRDPRMWRS